MESTLILLSKVLPPEELQALIQSGEVKQTESGITYLIIKSNEDNQTV